MALIEIYHVVADQYAIDGSSETIVEGMLVSLNGASGVRRVTTGDDNKVIGIAGDTTAASASGYAGLPGVYSGWQNRVSDSFNETKASAKLTVYHSGGKFATDQFVSGTTAAADVGKFLIADEGTGTLKYGGTDQGTLFTAGTPAIAVLTKGEGSYPSGVPGVDLNGDMALKGANTNQYIEFKLLI
jgi:hypothetical protein